MSTNFDSLIIAQSEICAKHGRGTSIRLFGGNGTETLGIDALEARLNSLFDRKLGQLDFRAAGIVRGLGGAKAKFGGACDIFYALDAKPDTEDMWNPNVTMIKSQKGAYAMALKKVVAGMQLEAGAAPNIYERYSTILENARSANTDILKVNARYKTIMHCYANHLKNFRKCTTELEKLMQAMERELESRSRELAEYNEVKRQITVLKAYESDLRLLESRSGSLKQERLPGAEEQEMIKELETKKKEYANASKQASGLYEKIRELVAPLERASKKFDHISAGKKRLYRFMSDPVASIGDQTEYAEFREMLKRLRERIGSENIDVKNKDAALSAADYLIESDLYSMIETYRELEGSRSGLDAEVVHLETELKYVRSSKESAEKAARDASVLQAGIGETKRSMDTAKAALERLFAAYYGRSVSVSL